LLFVHSFVKLFAVFYSTVKLSSNKHDETVVSLFCHLICSSSNVLRLMYLIVLCDVVCWHCVY